MGIFEPVALEPTPAQGAQFIRSTLRQTITEMQQGLNEVRRSVDRHGRSQIAGELGSDAAELQTVYNKIKQCLADVSPTIEVPDLPS